MKTLFPALQRLALTTAVVLTPLWLSGCATGPAGVNVPGLQQILEAGFTAKGGRDKIAVHEVIRTQDSFLFTKVTIGNTVRNFKNAGFTFVKDADEFERAFYWGGIVINDSLWTNIAIEFTQSPDDAVKKVRAGDLVLVDTRRADLQY
ncbi:MAG: hypothetical protein ING36_05625, partial [Burkholderiales bacterium]|nr:hypothetical protein [Burkholderiales bacterium]